MADDRRMELDDLVNRPGTYFNPQTEVIVVVDDSQTIDAEVFNLEAFEGADWVLISDEVPMDEEQRDSLLESFQAAFVGDPEARVAGAEAIEEVDADPDEDEDADPAPEDDV